MSEMPELVDYFQSVNQFFRGLGELIPKDPSEVIFETEASDMPFNMHSILESMQDSLEALRRYLQEHFQSVSDATRELHRYVHNIVDDGTFGALSDEAIEQARIYIRQKSLYDAAENMGVGIEFGEDLVALATLVAHAHKSTEQARDDAFELLAADTLIDRITPLLSTVPSSDNTHAWFLTRSLVGIAVKDGIVNFDDLMCAIEERTHRVAATLKKSSARSHVESYISELQTFVNDGIIVKAAMSHMDEKERAHARDKVKHAYKGLLKATRKVTPNVAKPVRSEIRALLRSLSLSSELARTDAGVYFELATESAARRHIPLRIPDKYQSIALGGPLGTMVTVDNVLVRAVMGTTVAGQFTQYALAKNLFQLERLRNLYADGSHIDGQYLVQEGMRSLRNDREDEESVHNANIPLHKRLQSEADKCASQVTKADKDVFDLAPYPRQSSGFSLPPEIMRGLGLGG